MGVDGYEPVLRGMERLLNHAAEDPSTAPRVVPKLTKVLGNTAEMETFFERWWQVAGHALIERFHTAGSGSHALLADQSPVPMQGPWRTPDPHQRKQRLTVLSDGRVTLCTQDVLGRAALGNLRDRPILELWQNVGELAERADQEQWTPDDSPLCRRCCDWLRMRSVGSPALAEVA
jgi:radical SAM protein with 4Fe4S-binding SPASM domain